MTSPFFMISSLSKDNHWPSPSCNKNEQSQSLVVVGDVVVVDFFSFGLVIVVVCRCSEPTIIPPFTILHEWLPDQRTH